jgi:hypothetical protein
MIVFRTVLEQVALTANKFAEGNIDLNSPMWRNHLLKALSSSSHRPPVEVNLKEYITTGTQKDIHLLFFNDMGRDITFAFIWYFLFVYVKYRY